MKKHPRRGGLEVRSPVTYIRPVSGYPFIRLNPRPLESSYCRWILSEVDEPGLKV